VITDTEWETLCLLIEEAWPGEFDDSAAKAWRVFLGDYDADAVAAGLKACVARGGRFRPAVAEIVAEIRSDPSRPTFDEAYQMIYGPGGVLGFKRSGVTVSPWVVAFVASCGQERLRLLEVDGEYGELNRKELRQSWEQFLEANETRDIAALAAGGPRRGRLGRFDPLEVLRLASRPALAPTPAAADPRPAENSRPAPPSQGGCPAGGRGEGPA